jgi:superfamily II DNA/RNA helicase
VIGLTCLRRLAETQLANLGIRAVSIKSSQTQEERGRHITKFNDPSSDFEVLLVTTALGAVSLNLQSAATIVVMEVPLSFYTLMQIIGRVNRIGQKFQQQVHLLWCDHSYDQMCLHRVLCKIVPSLAGESYTVENEDPEVTSQRLIQQFLGMKESHRPFGKEWGSSAFPDKDRAVAELEADPTKLYSENRPQYIQQLLAAMKKTPRRQKQAKPTQNILLGMSSLYVFNLFALANQACRLGSEGYSDGCLSQTTT